MYDAANRHTPQRGLRIVDHETGGASSRPPVTAHASCHGDAAPTIGHRLTTASHAPTIAATASANGEPATAGVCGSGLTATNVTVNNCRKPLACNANRRSGRGIALIEALSQSWGVQDLKGGKEVFAVLAPYPGPDPTS